MADNTIFLTSIDLAKRWMMPDKTLSQWRWNGRGPKFTKIGRHILYKIEDIEKFEEEKSYNHTGQYKKSYRVNF